MSESGKIVVIDDEASVRDVVKAYLEKDGFKVFVAANGREGLKLAEKQHPDLIVLDLMLPDVSGEEICEEVRSRSDVPIVMLTAKASEEERVGGLVAGADDYLVKPFSPRELVARVRAVLRRTRGVESPLVEVLRFDEGRLEIDTVKHAVLRDGRPVDLTPNEYKLLLALARYPGRAYSRFELVERVQGYDYEGYERTIDVHVKNLRKKIEPDPAKPRYVETVTGVGYRLAKL
jgi:DNA-binding response OmpR family regulator